MIPGQGIEILLASWHGQKKKKKPVTKHTLGRHLNLTVMECFCEFFGDLPAHNGGPSLGFSDMAKVSFTKLDSCMPTNEVRTHPSTNTKPVSKGLKDINVRHDTIKLLTP